jgi:hypothetical protein
MVATTRKGSSTVNSDPFDDEITNAPPEALHSIAGMLSVSTLAIKYLLDRPYRTHQFLDFVRGLPSLGPDDDNPSDQELIDDMHEAFHMAQQAAERADDYSIIAFCNKVAKEAANGSIKRPDEH